jgi:Na+/glutamate symporter
MNRARGRDEAVGAIARGPVVGVFDSGFGGLTVLRALLDPVGTLSLSRGHGTAAVWGEVAGDDCAIRGGECAVP